jgi:CxxC motif-containing protein (DUF1111 family)
MRHRHALLAGLLALGLATATPASSQAPLAPGDPRPNLSRVQLDRFQRGKVVFQRVFTPETGLGPLFNNTSCAVCHDQPAIGGSGFEDDDIETHASVFDQTAGTCDQLEAAGGPVFRHNATTGNPPGLPPSAGLGMGHRTTPALFGMGRIDEVPDAAILANEGQLGGRAHRLPDGRIGRFGRKATDATLAEFTQGAFATEMGIDVPSELVANDLALTVDFVRFLGLPTRLNRPGGALFHLVGCDQCHTPSLSGGPPLYTDLLLHDLGPNFQDMCRGHAKPTEFRTAPLIGLRFLQRFLHDGRAASVGQAVRLHGGQASPVIRRFEDLKPDEQALLIHFVKGL